MEVRNMKLAIAIALTLAGTLAAGVVVALQHKPVNPPAAPFVYPSGGLPALPHEVQAR
jgi:hypothetical protein